MPITPVPSTVVDPVAQLVTALEAATSALQSATPSNRGAWATSTTYAVGEVVTQAVQRYLCRTAHTSGTFAADLAAGKWVSLDAVAALAASSNLFDLASASAARTNLGLGTAATQASTAFDVVGAALTAQAASLQKASNLADVASVQAARLSLAVGAAEAFGSAAGTATSPAMVSPTIGTEMWVLSNFTVAGGLNSSTVTPSITANSTDQTVTTRVSFPAQTSSNVNVDQTYRLAFDYSNSTSAGGWAAIWVRATSNTGVIVSGTADQYLHANSVAERSGRVIFDFKPPGGSTCLEVSLRCWNNNTSGVLAISNVSFRRTGDVCRPMLVSQQYATGNYPNLYWFLRDVKSDTVKAASLSWAADGALGFAYRDVTAIPTSQPFVHVIPDPTLVTATGTQSNVDLTEQSTATSYSLRVQNNDQVWEVWNGSAYEFRGNAHNGETVRGSVTWRIDDGSGTFSTYTLARSLRTIRRFQVLLPTQIALSTGTTYANVDHTFTCFQDGIIRCDRTTTFLTDTLIRQHFEWMSSHDTTVPFLGRLGRGLMVTGEVDTHNKVTAPTLTPSTSTSGGTLAATTYSYKITAVTPYGESTPSAAVTQVTTGTTSTVTLTWSAASNASAYRIYGRTAGVERLLATIGAVTTWTDDGSLGIQPVTAPTVNTGRYYSGTNAMDSEHSTEATWSVWHEPRSGFCYGNIYDRDSVLARTGVAKVRTRLEMGSGVHKSYTNSEWTAGDTTTITAGTVWTATHYSFVYLPYDVNDFHREIALRSANLADLAVLYPAT